MDIKDYDPNRKWIIEVTEQQLCDIINDVEDIHRFLCGQMELFNATSYIDPFKNMHMLRDKLRELQPMVTPNLERGASFDWCGNGCLNKAQKAKIQRGYATYRNLLHCIEKYRNRDEFSIYKDETLTCGMPLAICYPKKDNEKGINNTSD